MFFDQRKNFTKLCIPVMPGGEEEMILLPLWCFPKGRGGRRPTEHGFSGLLLWLCLATWVAHSLTQLVPSRYKLHICNKSMYESNSLHYSPLIHIPHFGQELSMFSSPIMYHMYIYGAPASYLLMEAHIFFYSNETHWVMLSWTMCHHRMQLLFLLQVRWLVHKDLSTTADHGHESLINITKH
jgi:hypothetical protein